MDSLSLLQIANLLESSVEAKESSKNILKNLKEKITVLHYRCLLHFFITWVEERKSAGEILHDETQLFTHFLVRGVKYPSTRSTYREKPE